MEGWIKIHRCIKDSACWKEKPFSKGQAWIDLLLRASHKEAVVSVGWQRVPVKPGDIITSIDKLANAWGWSVQKVRSYQQYLIDEQMITKKSQTKYTLLTIVNWELYQDEQQTNNKQITNKQQTNNKQITTYKNVKNVKKVGIDKSIPTYKASYQSDELNKAIDDFVKMRKQLKKPLTDRAFKLAIEKLDKLATDDDTKLQIVNQTIEHCWLTFYPLKQPKASDKINWEEL